MDDTCAQCQEQFDLHETNILEISHGMCVLAGHGQAEFAPDDTPDYIHLECAARYLNSQEEHDVREMIREEMFMDGAAQVNAYLGGLEKIGFYDKVEVEEELPSPPRPNRYRGGRRSRR